MQHSIPEGGGQRVCSPGLENLATQCFSFSDQTSLQSSSFDDNQQVVYFNEGWRLATLQIAS